MNRYLFYMILLFVPLGSVAQNNDFDNFKMRRTESLNDYRDSLTQSYQRFIQSRWQAYETFRGEAMTRKPEPETPLTADSTEDRETVLLPCEELPLPHTETMDSEIPTDEVSGIATAVHFPFYGVNITISTPEAIQQSMLKGTGEREIAHLFQVWETSGGKSCASQLLLYKKNMALNGWGLLDLASHYARQLFPNQKDLQTSLEVYLLTRMGYDVRVGRQDRTLVLLVRVDSPLYDTPFTTLESQCYYLFGPDLKRSSSIASVYTYKRQLPSAERPISVLLGQTPRLGGHIGQTYGPQTFGGKKMDFAVNKDLIDFYAHYPTLGLPVYAHAAVSLLFETQVEQNLRPLIANKTQDEAVEVLLDYVQSFAYLPDIAQFGRERPFFCEENYGYPKNDCEDRSVLFAYLVRHLLKMDAVLVEYSDHVATAVHFSNPSKPGYCYWTGGKRYHVCDPTCIGAQAGQLDKRHQNEKAKIIK